MISITFATEHLKNSYQELPYYNQTLEGFSYLYGFTINYTVIFFSDVTNQETLCFHGLQASTTSQVS